MLNRRSVFDLDEQLTRYDSKGLCDQSHVDLERVQCYFSFYAFFNICGENVIQTLEQNHG